MQHAPSVAPMRSRLADRITRDAIARLFESEKDPMVVIKWKEIYESLEEGTDRCEDVANILERILLKHV